MSNQWARFVNFVDLSSLPALDIWILWTWRRKSDPNNVKDKQIFEAIRQVGMIKRILLSSTFWEFQLFTTNSNYKMSTSTIKSTVTIKFTSIDVSLWLEVWQEMWWAGEGERPTMELKNYKRWSQNINIFDRLFTFRMVISYLWQGMNREGKRGWWSAFAVEVKRRWNPEEKKTLSTPCREENVIVFSIYTRKWDCH